MNSNFDQKLSFRAFLSHDYKEEDLNIEFFRMFNEVADVQFVVDIGLKNLNVTRLEHRIRNCDAFVGLYPFPGDVSTMPKYDEILMKSRYFRLEMEFAARAKKPSIIFYDKRFQSVIQSLSGFSEYIFKAIDVRGKMTTQFQSQIRTIFKEFCERLRSEIHGNAAGFNSRRNRNHVGLLAPKGKGGYSEAAIQAIRAITLNYGNGKLLEFDWPPVADAKFYDQLDSMDWMFVDVGESTLGSGILGIIQSRFIPTIRMLKGSDRLEAKDWFNTNLSRFYANLDVGYRKDIVYWNEDIDSLSTQLESRVRVALTPSREEEIINSHNEALKYFRLAASGKVNIFFSYSGEDRKVAESMVVLFQEYFPTVFDYQDRGKSLQPSGKWREKIENYIKNTNIGILLISESYKDSPWCDWEKELLVNASIERGIQLFPVLLNVQARKMPSGLGPFTPVRFREDDTPITVTHQILKVIKDTSNKNKEN